MIQEQPKTAQDWLRLCEQYRMACAELAGNPQLRGVVWSQAGFAIECALKAAIHARERFNEWPRDRRDINVHSLSKLAVALGLEIDSDHPIAASWATVLQWQRSQMYNPNEFSQAVLNSLLSAAFSEEGVIAWIRQTYLRNY